MGKPLARLRKKEKKIQIIKNRYEKEMIATDIKESF